MPFPTFKKKYVVEARENGDHCFYLTKANSSEEALLNVLQQSLARKDIVISRDEIDLDLFVEASWMYAELCSFKAAMDNYKQKNNINPLQPKAADYGLTLINETNYQWAFDLKVSVLPTGDNQYFIQTAKDQEFILCDPVRILRRKALKDYPNLIA